MEQHEPTVPPSISIPSQQRFDRVTSLVEMKEIDLAKVYPVLPTTKTDENELNWFYSEGPFSELRLSSQGWASRSIPFSSFRSIPFIF